MLVQEICITWKLNEPWPLKKDSVTFLRLLKLLKLKKNSITVLKFLIPRLHHFLRTLKVFNIGKGLNHFLETLKGFSFEKWLYHILMTLKVFQNSYSGEQSLVKVAYHIIFMINELHLLWVPNFIAIGIYFLFGTKFSWNEETDTCFNVECVLLERNFDFLGCTARYLMVTTGYCSLPCGYCSLSCGYWSLLVVTARYRSLLLVPTFSMNEHLIAI